MTQQTTKVKMFWTPYDLPDLTGKTIVITGANSGIGFESARLLYQQNARIILACRNVDKAEAAIRKIRNNTSPGILEVVALDLADLASVKNAAAEIHKRLPKGLDVLINNAGVMALPRSETKDGFEMQFGTNHLGHFALTAQLYDLVKKKKGRIVTLSSIAHKGAKFNFNDIMGKSNYSRWFAYKQVKLANLVFALELQRRIHKAGDPVQSIPVHPGVSETNLGTAPIEQSGMNWLKPVQTLVNKTLCQSAEQGAWSSVFAAAHPLAKGGVYYGPAYVNEFRGPVTEAIVKPNARDALDTKRLWDLSEELTGLKLL
jgi:NAD(P)-dependent dehydrogenase (short-subunit alcohol dehydrogenase family)